MLGERTALNSGSMVARSVHFEVAIVVVLRDV